MFYSIEEQHIFLLEKLKNNELFALTRYGEGEIRVLIDKIDNTGLVRSASKDKTWEYNPLTDKYLKEELYKSITYNNTNYLKCFMNNGYPEYYNYSINLYPNIKKLQHNYFYSDIFYKSFYNEYVNLFKKYESINYICSSVANINNINIPIKNIWNKFNLKNAWKQIDYKHKVIEEISKYKNSVFLFSVGFTSKILIRKLFELNNNNIYFDIGANLDIKLYGKKTRGRHIV